MKRQPRAIRDYTDWTQKDFEEDLRTHPRYQAFFKDYKPESVSSFIERYAFTKYYLYQMKDHHYRDAEHRQSQFLTAAENFLAVILQKKLFNLQCLWRANLIDLPGIEYTNDFQYFRQNIWDCPYIEPITEAEIEVATRFLLEEKDDTYAEFDDWQEYEGFKLWDADDDEDEDAAVLSMKTVYYSYPTMMPDFYIYYDTCFQTSHLFNLPDHRWEKEKYYMDAVRAENARLHAISLANKPPEEPSLPELSSYNGGTEKFVAACEDLTTKELFEIKDQEVSHRLDDDEFGQDLRFLMELRNQGEAIALVPHTDWYDAIAITALQVRRKKTAEMLPYAYQTYMLEFEDQDIETLMAERLARFKYNEEDERDWYRQSWRRKMAEGRALRGE